jgi:hypothetical protein
MKWALPLTWRPVPAMWRVVPAKWSLKMVSILLLLVLALQREFIVGDMILLWEIQHCIDSYGIWSSVKITISLSAAFSAWCTCTRARVTVVCPSIYYHSTAIAGVRKMSIYSH